MKLKIILTIFIPLMLTLFMVIFLPSSLLLFANPKQEALYISNQIKTHEVSFRNVVYQNQKIIQKLIQSCEDIKSSLFQMFLNNSTYQSVTTSLVINNATTATQADNSSMYYTPYDISNVQSIYNSYMSIEMYSRAFIPYSPYIMSMTWTFADSIQFVFPTSANTITQDYNMFTTNYNTTMNNYNTAGSFYTTFETGSILDVCTVMISNTNTTLGTLCMKLNGTALFDQEYLVTTEEMTYLIMASTITSAQQTPNVIFTANVSTGVVFPTQQKSIPNIDPSINVTLLNTLKPFWYPNSRYNFYSEGFLYSMWYQFPIFLFNSQGNQQNVFFLFAESIIDSQLYSLEVGSSYLIEVTVIPTVMFIVSVIISYFVLNKIMNNLVLEIDLLVKKSQSLLDKDLDIKIPEYNETFEVKQVYDAFQDFSEVSKYSERQYFSGNHSEKTIKYYKALKLYTELKNSTVVGNIYQNLANLSSEEGNLQQAANYYKSSLESVQQLIVEEFRKQTGCETVREIYQFLITMNKRIPSYAKHLETTLIRRYYNYIQTSFRILSSHDFSHQDELREILHSLEEFEIILKQKKNDPAEIFVNTMSAKIYIASGNYDLAKKRLTKAEELYKQYQVVYEAEKNSNNVPPEIIYQHLSYTWGKFSEQQNKPLEAFQYYVAAFDGQTYDPLVRQKLLVRLKRLLITEEFNSSVIKQSVYFQPKTNEAKQYVIILDFSLSMATKIKIRQKILSRTKLAINESLRIFDEHIKPNDRISFIRFESGIQQIFNLTEKGKYERMLRGTIEQLSESQLRDGTALYNALKSVLLLVKGLKKQKIIIFIIDGTDNCSNTSVKDLQQLIKSLQITLLFITIDIPDQDLENLYELRNYCQTCYFVSIYAQDDINRILKGKSYKRGYLESYIL